LERNTNDGRELELRLPVEAKPVALIFVIQYAPEMSACLENEM